MKLFLKLLLIATTSLPAITNAQQQLNTVNNSGQTHTCAGMCCCAGNSQAPVGVMTDHIHNKGTWMLSYTFMNTAYSGNYSGNSRINDNSLYDRYMMAPETMNMQMHMLMAMYGVTDRLTLMVMGGYMVNSMNMNMSMSTAMMNMPSMKGMTMNMGNMTMQSNSSGLSDTRLSALYNFSKNAGTRLIGNLGIQVPTGSINCLGTTLLGDGQRLPYDMQTGTGTYNVQPDITYARKYVSWYFGANAGANIPMNFNSIGYKPGNIWHESAWVGKMLCPFLSATFRVEDINTGKIAGADPLMDNAVYVSNDPTTDKSNYGGSVVNAYIGLNCYFMRPVMDHFRLLAEYGLPVYQNLNGVQSALKSQINVGLQYAIK